MDTRTRENDTSTLPEQQMHCLSFIGLSSLGNFRIVITGSFAVPTVLACQRLVQFNSLKINVKHNHAFAFLSNLLPQIFLQRR